MSHAQVTTDLVARDATQQAVIARARKSLEEYGRRATATLDSIAVKFTALGVAAGAGLFALAKSQMDAVEATADLAAALDTTTERLTALRHVAYRTGADATVMDEALKKLTLNLGMAKQGAGEAVGTLKQLGLSVNDLANRDPAVALLEIAGAMEKIPTAAEKSATAAKLLGEGGTKLVSVLSLGKQGLIDAANEAKRLGVTLADVDAARVIEAQNAFKDLRESTVAAAQAMTIALAPTMKRIADTVNGAISAFNRLSDSKREAILRTGAVVTAMVALGTIIPRVVAGIRSLVAIYQTLAKAQVIQQALSGPAGWAVLATGAAAATTAAILLDAAFEQLMDSATGAAGAAEKATDSHAGVAAQMAAATQASTAYTAALQKERDAQKQLAEQIDRQGKSAIQAYQEEYHKLRRAWIDGSLTAKQLSAGIDQLNEKFFGGTESPLQKYIRQMQGLRDAMDEAGLTGEIQGEVAAGFRKLFQKEFLGEDVATPLEKYKKAMAELTEAYGAHAISTEQFRRRQQQLGKELAGEDVLTPIEAYKKALAALDAALSAGAITQDQYNRRKKEAAKAFGEDVLTPVEKYKKALEDLRAELDAGAISQEQYDRRAKEAAKAFGEDILTPVEKLRKAYDELKTAYEAGGMSQEQFGRRAEQLRKGYLQESGVQGLYDATRTPTERYKAELARLDKMRQEGAFGFEGGDDLYKRAVKAARDQYQPQKPASFEGLEQLYKRIASSAAGGRPEERTAEATEKTAKATERVATKLDEVKTEIRNSRAKGGSAKFGK